MMTTMTTMAALPFGLPQALGSGAGSAENARRANRETV